jgi:sugar lactone lactonase YvrE
MVCYLPPGSTLLGLILLLIAPWRGAGADHAVAEFKKVQQELETARTNHDWSASLVSANDQNQLLNGQPDALLELARAKVHTGDLPGAFHDLEQFVRMGQATDLLATSTEFAPLRDKPEFATIESGMKENREKRSLGEPAIRLADPALLPEDLDYDPERKLFFITTVRGKKIVTTDHTGSVTDFAQAPDGWPMLAIKIDRERKLLWATEVALQGFGLVAESDWGRSAVLCYDLKNGKLLHRVEGPPGCAFGDMALMAKGDVIVSDGDGGGVYQVQANGEGLERLDPGSFISPQTPAVCPDGERLFIPDYLRGIAVLDLSSQRVRWLSMEGRFALNGIDGLYLEGRNLLAIQNGTSPERVVAFQLDAALSKITSQTIIEGSTETLGDPTHGVMVGTDFYYIANSGWDIIDDHGRLKPGAQPTEALIMRVPLSAL